MTSQIFDSTLAYIRVYYNDFNILIFIIKKNSCYENYLMNKPSEFELLGEYSKLKFLMST